MTNVPKILTPRCPMCDEPPVITIPGGLQAFCGNDDCNVLMWCPSKDIEGNLRDAGFVNLMRAEDGSDEGSGEDG
jgi:hypothetical protein